jgi:hypothetical protein
LGHVRASYSDEIIYPPTSAESRPAPPPDRAVERWIASGLWQRTEDDPSFDPAAFGKSALVSEWIAAIHLKLILATFLNEVITIPDPFILILDDYQLIDAEPIDQALSFMLDHLASQMHLVIVTREDPLLPLSRYCARGQLIELRAADLHFYPGKEPEHF